ncbi:ankyrin repeat domain-containing protein SOWAHC [Eurytemora carolleeae]|uniref:ankyrin repeat domain-containing protein SOWAHC n=1 Tax=Eurytemora carolleeae TaxID=1294199 RepID=UPI000C774027|nr:ankyrin repeat domain-containing protein SOWAHC [Eurytemora carolleeae]|eukprot:XP_023342698.1 ankyrin repeat domain-containing protein SOWAHC-like [Eurytemora affinis]
MPKKRIPFHPKSNSRGLSNTRTKPYVSWMLACSTNSTQEIKFRLETEPDLAVLQDELTGQSCIHWMVKHNNKEIVDFLIKGLKVSPNIVNRSGQTPLHIAALYDRRELYQILIYKHQADITIRDNSGRLASNYIDQGIQDLTGPGILTYGSDSRGIKLSWRLLAQDIQDVQGRQLTTFNNPGQKVDRRRSEDLGSGSCTVLQNKRRGSIGRMLDL